MATIKAIEARSVHQIQSGQVIVDLISVVKELVENSLDAGATSIDIRFKNQGLDSIEVQDNGKGIAPEDFNTLALKHHTSKLSNYEDLTSLETFGFRGEALSSLCALSHFHVITARAEDGAVGRRLEFEASGMLKSNSVVAAQKGTTVSVEGLFHNLPVRRKELEKNVKREYNKVLAHLYAYACISVGVRFAVTNQMARGQKVPVFSTKSNTTTKENITNVFGAKTLVALVKLDLHLKMQPSMGPSTQSARTWSTQANNRSKEVRVEGYISKPVFGEGRQAPDRQMLFVNFRPCGLPQVTKAVNEVYRAFNVSQSPFVFANLIMDTDAYDVNVSPDKRSIMLHDQTSLLESFKASLTDLFERSDQTVPQSQLPERKLPHFKPLTVSRSGPDEEASSLEDNASNDGSEHEDAPTRNVHPRKTSRTSGNADTPSLIESWAERDAAARRRTRVKTETTQAPTRQNDRSLEEDVDHVSTTSDARPSLNALDQQLKGLYKAGDGMNIDANHAIEHKHPGSADPQLHRNTEPDPVGSPCDDLFSQRPKKMPTALEQFNALMNREHAIPVVVPNESAANPDDQLEQDEHSDDEPEIPSITCASQKGTPGPVQNAFDRMRPKRTPLQTAEVSIGDKTTTTFIGSSPPYKRRRIHQPANSQSIAQFGGSPLLARGLRNFAAPGTHMQSESSAVPNAEARFDSEDGEDDDNPQALQSSAHDEIPPNGLEQSDAPISDPLDSLLPAPADDDELDEDYMDDEERKTQEDEKIARLIQEAELALARPTEENLRRASQVMKNGSGRREATVQLASYVDVTIEDIRKQSEISTADAAIATRQEGGKNNLVKTQIEDADAESKLSLTVTKSDFDRMHIIGQFNLGFVLAVRPQASEDDEDQLFIIDQHASDEKYNYERLQRTVTLQNQRLVRPKALELTAVEEEIVKNHADALKANGFEIEVTSDLGEDEEISSGRRCRLITLPISGEKTFDLSDLEELLHLISEAPAGSSEIPRPKKVQKMLAMRACRSSIMVGKTLTLKQMQKVVRHMGEMEKPWNCPHGRPTMRHLAGLGSWSGWKEGDNLSYDEDDPIRESTDWTAWLDGQ